MKNINHAIASMTGICILLGVIIGIQAKTVKKQITTVDVQRVSELSVELKKRWKKMKIWFVSKKKMKRK